MDRPVHEALWLTCSTKRCCYTRTVLPSGADIWRIATALDAAPEHFLRMIPAEAAGEGFMLDHSQQCFHAALARRSLTKRSAACVFLVVLGERAARCGLDALRPMPCQLFPVADEPGMLRIADDHGCTCRSWSLAEVDRIRANVRAQQAQAEQAQYVQIIRDWNSMVEATAAPRYAFGDFCRYVLHVYAQQPNEARDD